MFIFHCFIDFITYGNNVLYDGRESCERLAGGDKLELGESFSLVLFGTAIFLSGALLVTLLRKVLDRPSVEVIIECLGKLSVESSDKLSDELSVELLDELLVELSDELSTMLSDELLRLYVGEKPFHLRPLLLRLRIPIILLKNLRT
ncbi:hypothetical protein K501DRAFT_267816 [Backusella circina FSU 941]|nr:hypothetical protein K501DRAFT_267816 [Backusella circina FSU 941]